MIRLIIGFVLILALVAGAAWMADHPGAVHITFENFVVDTSVAALTMLIAALVLIACGIFWAYIWLRNDAPIVGKNRILKRQQRGLEHLNDAMLALAAGDHSSAQKHIGHAELLLPPEPMVQLVAAEAATRANDNETANKYYRELEKNPRARFLGLRGLLVDARRSGRSQEALRLAREALAENSKSRWALDSVFELEVASADWQSARETLVKAQKRGVFDAETVKSHRGALSYAQAVEQAMSGDLVASEKSLRSALKDRPGFTPAATRLARMEVADGNQKKAERFLKAVWKVNPHPDVITAIYGFNPTASNSQMKDIIRTLTLDVADHPASLIARASAAKNAGDFSEAKHLLEQLLLASNSHAAWQMMADINALLGEDNSHALDMAAAAPADPSWTCSACHSTASHWAPLCETCGSFNKITWGSFAGNDRKNTVTALKPPMTILEDAIAPPRPAEG